jgi:hypothetical protein
VLLVAVVLASLLPAGAWAQTATGNTAPPATSAGTRTRGGDITRDEYIQRAVDRARRAAETRFDRLDANRDGVLTADERRAARAARKGGAAQQ